MKDKNKNRNKGPQPSRRAFMGAAAAAVTAGVSGCITVESTNATSGDLPPEPALMLVNGRIHTMDANNTVASSVVIRNRE